MTDPNKAAIMLVVDRSGSMHSLRASAQDSINEFITGMNLNDGVARTLAIAHFDHEYELVNSSMPVKDCPAFRLDPRGSTALLDAMGRAIDDLGAELAALPEERRPAKVVMAIVTDGFENASRTFTWDDINKKVRHQEEAYKWEIMYLAADEDAIATAAKLGVRADHSLSYSASNAGTGATYDMAFASISGYTGTDSTPIAFTYEDREKAMAEDSD
jgi:hypothetical protein